MSASFKDEDSTQLFKNCRKIWKCCDKIFSGGRISDSRVCKLFCTTRRRKREERLSLKTKTAGNSAQNLTDFLIISGFTRNPAHWPSHRVHWTSGAVLLMVLKPNPMPLESELWTPPSYCFLSLTTDMSPESSLSQKMGPRLYIDSRDSLIDLLTGQGQRGSNRRKTIKLGKGEEKWKEVKTEHLLKLPFSSSLKQNTEAHQVHLWKFVSTFCGNLEIFAQFYKWWESSFLITDSPTPLDYYG